MQILSKPAAYLGDRKPYLPDAYSHQDNAADYVFSPESYVLGSFAKLPQIRIKKTRHLPVTETTDTGPERTGIP